MAKQQPTRAWGIASLLLAIFSLFFFWLPIVGLVIAITAIVFYNIQARNERTSTATAGLVIGIFGTIMGAIMILLMLIGMLAYFAE